MGGHVACCAATMKQFFHDGDARRDESAWGGELPLDWLFFPKYALTVGLVM